MIYITSATEEDLPVILEIEQEAISPPWTHGALLSEIYREDSFFAVARGVARDVVIGAGRAGVYVTNSIAQENHPPDTLGFVIVRRAGDDGELLQIAVNKTLRRQGIADILMDAALSYGSERGLSSVYLEARRSNISAICLYKKHGFKSVRYRKDYYHDPIEDAVVMVRSEH